MAVDGAAGDLGQVAEQVVRVLPAEGFFGAAHVGEGLAQREDAPLLVVATVGSVPEVGGRIVGDDKEKIVVMTDPFDANKIVEIAKGDVEEVTPSRVSLMPTGLLDKLNRDEVLDLLAYLLSRGNPNDQIFQK